VWTPVQARRWSAAAANGDTNYHAILRAVCGTKEIEYYMNKFKAYGGDAFAVIKVGGDVVEYDLADLTETCSTLWNAGLMPVVIHGGGPQMNDELARQNIEPQYINGSRVTDEATLAVARRIFTMLNGRVVQALQEAGTEAVGFPEGIFRAEVRDKRLKFVGDVSGINAEKVRETLKQKKIPVLTSLGVSESGQVLNINADVAARDLVVDLQPMRVLFASAKGGWLDEDTGQIVNVVDMANEYDDLASLDYTGRQGTLLKLNEIKQILDRVPPTTSVSITSANTMLKELFSHKGAGSLFLRGEPVQKLEGATSTSLLKDIDPDFAVADATFVYGSAEKAKAAARIVFRPKLGKDLPPIIEQLAVAGDSQGMGHESVLWDQITRLYPSLAWTFTEEDMFKKEDGAAMQAGTADSDGTYFDRDTQTTVAWYNRGHPLKGWSYDKAPRLIVDMTPKNTKSISSYRLPPHASGKVYKVGLLGARGYVGREFVKLLTQHPNMELTVASSRALTGQRVIDCFGLDKSAAKQGVSETLLFNALEPEDLPNDQASQEVDIWVLALPNGLAPKFVQSLEKIAPEATYIDLGADYRFDETWIYGLPERHGTRGKLRGAKRISNPGCYATGAQVALMPLLQPLSDSQTVLATPEDVPVVFGLSGYSGAGTNPSDKNDPQVLKDNVIPYSLVNHMHERECSKHLRTQIGFMPHVASYFQGIHLTSSSHVQKVNGKYPTVEEIFEAYKTYYEGQPLIQVSQEAPLVKDNMFHHHVAVGGFSLDEKTGRLAVVSTIDNLLKGAATQAMQNLNLSHGIDEYTALIDEYPTMAN